jgi:hypothetical protein
MGCSTSCPVDDPRTAKLDVVPIGHTREGIAASEGDLGVAVHAPEVKALVAVCG